MRPWRRLSLLLAGLLAAVCMWLTRGLELQRPLRNDQIRAEGNHTYSAVLERTPRLTIARNDENTPLDRASTVLREDGRTLGPAHASRTTIQELGQGAFFHHGNALFFSTSDNSDPRTNGRSYAVGLILVPSTDARRLVLALLVGTALLNADLLWRETRSLGRRLGRVPPLRWAWVNLMPGCVITLVLLLLVAIAGEIWIRLKADDRFIDNKWPGTWSSEAGFTFAPNAELQFTNNLDFWVRQKTNSRGFADREWTAKKDPGVIRIAFIGDSYVEAAQVPIAQKSHVVFEQLANQAFAPRKIETAAFGMSGTGQTNQLQFYDHAAREFQPDVVVLVVVSNDFANNSALLEGVRQGWHPDHLPRLFFTRKNPGDPLHLAPLDPHWSDYQLPDGSVPQPGLSGLSLLHQSLMGRSFFYPWLVRAFELHFPRLAVTSAQPTVQQTYVTRLAAIRHLPGYEHRLDGWNFPDDWSLDDMFAMEHLAPVFEEAVEATGRSLDEFVARSRRDGFRLVALFTNSMTDWDLSYDPVLEQKTGNRPLEHERFARFKHLTDARGIPVVDFGRFLEERKIPPKSAAWPHDAHWSPRGHKLAAQALLEAFQAHPDWLTSHSSARP